MKALLIISMAVIDPPPLVQIPMESLDACTSEMVRVYYTNPKQPIKFIATCVKTEN